MRMRYYVGPTWPKGFRIFSTSIAVVTCWVPFLMIDPAYVSILRHYSELPHTTLRLTFAGFSENHNDKLTLQENVDIIKV